jgi:hypothetical protein
MALFACVKISPGDLMNRVEHWERLLAAAIDTARAKPFVWGIHDCPTFAFETAMILTGGEDTAALWRGRYKTALGGERVMRRMGWASLEDMGRALLGAPRPAVLLAQRGDIVLADTGLGFGLCTGASAVGIAPEGFASVPLTSCRLAWPI